MDYRWRRRQPCAQQHRAVVQCCAWQPAQRDVSQYGRRCLSITDVVAAEPQPQTLLYSQVHVAVTPEITALSNFDFAAPPFTDATESGCRRSSCDAGISG